MLAYLVYTALLVPYLGSAPSSLMAILLNNKPPLSVLLVDNGALGLLSRVRVLCERSEIVLLVLCSEVRVLGILNGP